ncbi:hypothetical protein M407DRAFT_26019 [Tulasnella calospora MUT 4182]|uniref:Uncharacterized protein n=1 Tax=Tulasnella calospora MUT 4182 TaxID=1051891 RepID=A0A0C3QBB6_9AGAM|nr:hypothetical protein M407DRAFT_28765 [Tulasnella calospora MUT 4182]KIO24595.1 hypothetical protein M407DRAFT_26019 [Tulasnella calospora MUT 4182]
MAKNSLSVDGGYALDDLLFVVHPRHPTTLTKRPYLSTLDPSTRAVILAKAQSSSGRKNPTPSPAQVSPGSGAVYFLIFETKFILWSKFDHAELGNAGQGDKFHTIVGSH